MTISLEARTSLRTQRDTHCEIRRLIYSRNFEHCGVYRNVFRQETIIADVRGRGSDFYVDRTKVL